MANRDDFDREILDIIPERFDADADSRMARKSARNGILVTVSLGILAVMAVGVTVRHFLFGEVPRDHQLSVPVIHAEDKPIKVKPQDRGGMDVPNQDKLIYDQMAAKGPPAPPERLLPPPEQAQTPPPADQRTPSTASVTAALPPPATSAPPAKPASEPAPVAAMTASAGPAMPKGVPSPVAPTSKPQPVAKPAAPAPATPTAPAAPTAAVHGGGWVVQLGAVRSEAEAKTEWARLKNAHKEELGDLSSDIMRVDLGAKGIFWRVRGGPLDEAQARLLCAQLTKQSQGCIIARK